MTNTTIYATSIMELAAFLVVRFRGPNEVKRLGTSTRYSFIFQQLSEEEEDAIDTLVQSFWDGKETIEPIAYFNALKALKGRIHNQEK